MCCIAQKVALQRQEGMSKGAWPCMAWQMAILMECQGHAVDAETMSEWA